MSEPFKVKLASRGNPDFRGQDPSRPLYGCPKDAWKECATIKECAEACQAYIHQHDLGGGNWTGGEIRQGKKFIGRISYNGRIWNSKTFEPGAKEIFP